MRLALAWTAAVALLLFLPSGWIVSPPPLAAFGGHLVLFAVSTGLWLRAVPHRQVAVVVLVVALALGSELVQATLVPGRGAEPLDGVANLAGTLLGLVATAIWRPAPSA